MICHRQTKLARQCRGISSEGLAPDLDFAQIGVNEPASNPKECRLSGAVLADKGVNFSRSAVEADVAQCAHSPELSGHATERKDQVLVTRSFIGIASVHWLPNINASTLSGTNDVPETAGVARSGLQSSAVT